MPTVYFFISNSNQNKLQNPKQHPQIKTQREYRHVVRKNLRILLNLHDPDSEQPCSDAWRLRLADFTRVPVPCPVEEATVKHLEAVLERGQRSMEKVRRQVATRRYIRTALPAPRPFHFNWRKFMWNSNRGSNMLPK